MGYFLLLTREIPWTTVPQAPPRRQVAALGEREERSAQREESSHLALPGLFWTSARLLWSRLAAQDYPFKVTLKLTDESQLASATANVLIVKANSAVYTSHFIAYHALALIMILNPFMHMLE